MIIGRIVSGAAVGAVVGLLFANRAWLAEEADWMTRIGLALTLIGTTGAAVHALGQAPSARPLQVVASPRAAWPAIVAGLCLIVASQTF